MRFNFKSAVWAGIVATLAMSFVMGLFGVNFIRLFAALPGIAGTSAYLIGVILYFLVGIIYALIYALFFEPLLKKLPKFLAGALYGLVPFIIFTILTTSSSKLVGAAVPCAPCGGILEDNPPPPEDCTPCNPCGPQAMGTSPRSFIAAAVPCAPSGGLLQDNPPAMPKNHESRGWPIFLINYVVYGIVLGLVYRPKERS